MPKKDFSKVETKNSICINVFCYENKMTLPIYVSDKKFEDSIDLLLEIDVINRIMCISWILTDLCFTKQRIETENAFVKVVYSLLVV